MALVHWKDVGDPSAVPRYLLKRVVRIYPIFWVVLLITASGQLALGQIEPSLASTSGWIKALLLVPFDGFPPVVAASTLSHELLFYALLAIALFFGRYGFIAVGIWWAMCLVALFWGDAAVGYPNQFLLSPYNLLFGFGMIAAKSYARMSLWTAGLCLTAGIATFAATIFFDAEIPYAIRPLFYGAGAMAIVSGAARLEMLGRLEPPRILVYLGDASYSTYLIHSVAMTACIIVLDRVGVLPGDPSLPLAVILLIAGNVAGIVLYHYVERPLLMRMQPSGRRRMTGGVPT